MRTQNHKVSGDMSLTGHGVVDTGPVLSAVSLQPNTHRPSTVGGETQRKTFIISLNLIPNHTAAMNAIAPGLSLSNNLSNNLKQIINSGEDSIN